MAFIFSVFLVILLGFLDGSLASTTAGLLILVVTAFYSRIGDRDAFNQRMKLALAVLCVYMICSFIFSRSFEDGKFYIVSDSMRYIDFYGKRIQFYMDKSYFIDCYYGLSDSNVLFNATLLGWCIVGNTLLGGTTVFYITLLQTLFGILGIITVFRILNIYFKPEEALKYTFIFACCSLYLFYSCVVIRDIVISFFYILAIEIVLKEYRNRNLILLCVFMLIVWGLRLYSGFFYSIFIALYLYMHAQNSKYKGIAIFFFIAVSCVAVIFIAESAAMDQTFEELEYYEDMTSGSEEAKGGLIATLYKLPLGLKQLSIMLYSQMAPFPSFSVLMRPIESFSQLVMTADIIVYEFFWFFIFYILLCSVVRNHVWGGFSMTEKFLIVIAIIFLLANTSHPDIRRMMPVYPIIYLLFLKSKYYILPASDYVTNKNIMAVVYFLLSFIYLAIKGI